MSQLSIITENEGAGNVAQKVLCHPGEVLREEFMMPLGLSGNKLALALRIPSGRIIDIINEKRSISPDTALRLARYFGTSASLWINLQASFDLRTAYAQSGDTITREIIPMDTKTTA